MRVLFLAAPLTARSGVYLSAQELLKSGISQGYDWHLLLGVRTSAPKTDNYFFNENLREFEVTQSGIKGLRQIYSEVDSSIKTIQPDIIVSFVPQTDMILARMKIPWVAYVRGQPWPAKGESHCLKTQIWKFLETRALKNANHIFVTSEILKVTLKHLNPMVINPGLGLENFYIDSPSPHTRKHIVWAGRLSAEKDPELFLNILRQIPSESGLLFGDGGLKNDLYSEKPENVAFKGWVSPEEIWNDCKILLGTSKREAFGRTAVEAASRGIPIIISSAFGVAKELYTDENFRELFIIESRDPQVWVEAIQNLTKNEVLSKAVSLHLRMNAKKFSLDNSVRTLKDNLKKFMNK